MTAPLPPCPASPLPRPAVFLDRDGTLILDPGYQRDPAAVQLLPGAAAAVRRLNAAGLVVVVLTNQSGIAQGFITEEEYAAVERRIAEAFAELGARIDATYHCPHHPSVDGPCQCRKPGTQLHRKAAEDWRLDLPGSWSIGDRLSDLEPLRALGGHAILVRTGTGRDHEAGASRAGYPVEDDLGAAVDRILGRRGADPSP